ncbi:response regulator transcription factor [Pseudomonas mosselii]|uniref:response regulator transcription factor n=1 Tax=Pseudomonas mosselii TaxID=78327 RepID=UPI003F2CE1B0
MLNPREITVLKLVEPGCSNQEIADTLFISLFTVKSHIQRMSAKLNAKRRGHAVSEAKAMGII